MHDKMSKFTKELNCLPCKLSILKLPAYYANQIQNIPSGLTKLICHKDYLYQKDFANIEVETY